MNNAPAEYVEDLALIGFSHHMSADQLEFAAKSLGELIDHDVDPVVIEEIISYGIYNNWSGKAIAAVSDGIIRGVDNDLNSRKLTLALIISVDQNIDDRELAAIVDENIEYIEKIDSQPHVEPESEKVAYAFLQKAISHNVPRRISEELYFISLREKWSAKLITAVFEGIIRGHEQGLSPEKLATSIIVRVAQGATEINPQKLVSEEIKYVHQLERKKVELLRKDQRKFKRQPEPVQQRDDSYISTGSKTTEMDDKHFTYYRQADRNQLNHELMEQRIRDFLGPPATPYRWGGTSIRGVDCSGFVQAVYFSQGIYLPRISRRQVYIGHQVAVNELKFGDLLFFSKYFNNYITHVGIYLGNGRFVHASCSKGVVISSLANKYYRHRFRVAKRVVG
ncbi:hypothetical protein GF337_08160 [candidate division KSB1 bacterium]|nr:hypothetical protein [candidate division KSB1 bacterium]